MDETEARSVLQSFLDRVRGLPYATLVERYLGDEEHTDVRGASGAAYQVEVQGFWDDPRLKGGNLRVMVSIDDGGWRAFVPMTESFIVAPDGRFVGE
jgi:hypothetical protein